MQRDTGDEEAGEFKLVQGSANPSLTKFEIFSDQSVILQNVSLSATARRLSLEV